MTGERFARPVVATYVAAAPSAPLVVLLHGRERCGRVCGAVRRDDRGREALAGHHSSTGTSSAAVRTPAHRRTSPGRSRRSTGAALAKSPQLNLGSIHITSNSLPSGSLA